MSSAAESGVQTALVEALVRNRAKVSELEDEYTKKIADITVPYKQALEALLVKRQPTLDAQPGFWAKAIASPSAPTRALLDETADLRILRAVKSFRVATSYQEGTDHSKLVRRITFTLNSNIFIENAELFREIDGDGATLAIGAVKWKVPERARQNSIFGKLFDAATGADTIKEAVDAFDEVFQNPQLFIDDDEAPRSGGPQQ